MSIEQMRKFLKQKYGATIKSKAIDQMAECQVLAIYTRILNTKRRQNA